MKPRISSCVLRPDHEHVGDRRVRDPRLASGEAVAAGDLLRARLHRARVGAVVGLGEAEAADPLAGGELRQVLLALRFGAELEDRHHHERGLHAHHGAVARVDALDLARDEAVGDVVEAGAAVLRRNRRPEQAERAHLAKDAWIRSFGSEGFEHARRQLVLAVRARRVAHHALVLGELLLEKQRVVPDELGLGLLDRSVHYCILSRITARPWPTPMHSDTAA